ncbi:RICIN domain-containing protein [Jidongwangia harbinensis]|uniref:RICIN domain-containing protein n=1 Tax=Jidongwangia harbinensis TaxID=2878561 RepID=UPI001CDA2B47|nr:RICIN domain-containing protein [Jidongwangia harbinensis]MCA2213467.1 RICIN domain-containing protein [Jidongwangia harbinensis]
MTRWHAGLSVRRISTVVTLTLAAVALGVPQTATAAITPASGVQIKAAHSRLCLNVDHDRQENGVPIFQYTCVDAAPNDKWRVRPIGTAGDYHIFVSNSSRRCMHVSQALKVDNTPIIQYGCVDTAKQNLWRFVPVPGRPTFRIVSADSGKCLAIKGGGIQNEAPLVIFTCGTTNAVLNDQFYFPPAAAPDPTPLAIVPQTTIAGVQGGAQTGGAFGPLVYAWIDVRGRMVRGYQQQPDDVAGLQWAAVPDGETFAGHPQIGVQADGRVQTGVRNTKEGDLWLTTQTTAGQSAFGAGQDVGGAGAQQPAVGKLPDGRLVTFAVVNGAMWHLPQDGRNMPYGEWRLVGGANLTGEPSVVTTREGLRLFALDTSGAVQTATYVGGALSDWVSLGSEQFTGRIAATVLPGFRARVVVRSADGLVFTKAEKADGTFDAEWAQLGDFVAAGPPAAVQDPVSGAVSIVARGTDNLVYWVGEKVDEVDVFGSWVLAHPRAVKSDPTVFAYNRSNGPTWAYLVIDENNAPFLYRMERSASAARAAAGRAQSEGGAFTEHALPRPPQD